MFFHDSNVQEHLVFTQFAPCRSEPKDMPLSPLERERVMTHLENQRTATQPGKVIYAAKPHPPAARKADLAALIVITYQAFDSRRATSLRR
jgi:hypothetical protein